MVTTETMQSNWQMTTDTGTGTDGLSQTEKLVAWKVCCQLVIAHRERAVRRNDLVEASL